MKKNELSYENVVETFRKAGPMLMYDGTSEKCVVDFSLCVTLNEERIGCDVTKISEEVKRNMRDGQEMTWDGDNHVSVTLPITTKFLTVHCDDGSKVVFRVDLFNDGSVYQNNETTRFFENKNGSIFTDNAKISFTSGTTLKDLIKSICCAEESYIRFFSMIDTGRHRIVNVEANKDYYRFNLEKYSSSVFHRNDVKHISKSFIPAAGWDVFTVITYGGKKCEITCKGVRLRDNIDSFDIDVINNVIAESTWKTIVGDTMHKRVFVASKCSLNQICKYSLVKNITSPILMGKSDEIEIESHNGEVTRFNIKNITHVKRYTSADGVFYELTLVNDTDKNPSIHLNIKK